MIRNAKRNIIFFIMGILFNYFFMRKLAYNIECENDHLKEDMVLKDNLINRVMDKWDIMLGWKRLEQKGVYIARWFTANGYKNIAIYGLGEIGELLVKELLEANIKILYIIDRNKIGKTYHGIPVIDLQQEMGAVDCIVITTVRNFEEIQEDFEKRGNFVLFDLKRLITIIEKEN